MLVCGIAIITSLTFITSVNFLFITAFFTIAVIACFIKIHLQYEQIGDE